MISMTPLQDLLHHVSRVQPRHSAGMRVKNRCPSIVWRSSDHDRIDTTFRALQIVYERCQDAPPDVDFWLYADDCPPEDDASLCPMFAYCSRVGSRVVYNVPYGGISALFGYPASLATWRSMWQHGGALNKPFAQRQDVLYWIGGRMPYRQGVVDTYGNLPGVRMEFSGHGKFVPLTEQNDYKYLLDMQGIGWSARLMALVFMGAVLFVLDRDTHEFWFPEYFEPDVHYVAVAHDGHDLATKLEEIKRSPDGGQSIADACHARAMSLLTEEFFIGHFKDMLRAFVEQHGSGGAYEAL